MASAKIQELDYFLPQLGICVGKNINNFCMVFEKQRKKLLN